MGKSVLKVLLVLIACLIGAVDIRYAITHIVDGNYFVTGWYIMNAVWMASIIFNIQSW